MTTEDQRYVTNTRSDTDREREPLGNVTPAIAPLPVAVALLIVVLMVVILFYILPSWVGTTAVTVVVRPPQS